MGNGQDCLQLVDVSSQGLCLSLFTCYDTLNRNVLYNKSLERI